MPKPRNVTLWYLTRDRHWLVKRPDQPFTQRSREKLDYIVPWGRPIVPVGAEGDDFTDGPVCDRLAVIDLDAGNEVLRPPVRLLGRKDASRYEVDADLIEATQEAEALWALLESDEFVATSCFATVLYTVQECERRLGRPVTWATASPQLLLVPRAGELRNAFYERESGSIQFFYWVVHDAAGVERTVYTSLSHDIVAHEATHAILDGLLPDLYNASAPESLAIHESYADLMAIAQNVDAMVFEASQRNVDQMQEFSEVAEEFGAAVRTDTEYLRSALNRRTLDPSDTSVDPLGYPNLADVTDPHVLSQVLTGAVYGAFVRFFRSLKGDTFWKLWASGDYFSPILIETLNYVPPGELSFADVARAMLVACEQSRHHAPQIFADYFEEGGGYGKPPLVPAKDRRAAAQALCDRFDRLLRDEFVKRNIVDGKSELDVAPTDLKVDKATRASLVADTAAAETYVEERRELLSVSDNADPTVEVQEAVIKRLYCKSRRQVLVRVRWEQVETIDTGGDPEPVMVPVGTTLVIDGMTGKALSLLHTHRSERRTSYRAALLQDWSQRGLLVAEGRATGYDGKRLRDSIVAQRSSGGLRLQGSAHALHICGDD